MKLHFLSAQRPLTKKYARLPDGSIEKTSYLNAYQVTSHTEHVVTLSQMFDAITKHAAEGHCMVKGDLTRDLVDESRAGSTDSDASTSYLCLDIDGVSSKHSVEQLLEQIGLGDHSYILQWSASQGITDSSSLRCHIFVLLAKPVAAPLLKQWLIQLNFQAPALNDSIGLTKTNMALGWGLDITACQNDKLIYIAAPILENIRSPLGRAKRYELITKRNELFTVPSDINTPEVNRALINKKISDLRTAANLPTHRLSTRTFKDIEVMSKPGEAVITGIREERGFVYLNLNGGDSWGYYHPDDNCEIIYNFKGELPYATKELLPDYYAKAKKAANSVSHGESSVGAYIATPEQPVLLAFRDAASGVYKHGKYDPGTDTLLLNDARNEKQVRDFCMQNEMPMGDFVPIWDMVFNPQSDVRLDIDERRINLFQRSEFMLGFKPSKKSSPPKTIAKIVSHVLAHDPAAIAHLYNWLAFIVQRRERPSTAWVWYGTEGTGKGLLANKVLRPMLGMGQTTIRRGGELAEPYNGYMKNNMLVIFDEAHIAEMKDAEAIMGKLRNFITEPTVSLRMMHANAIEIPNFAGIICMSNKPNVVLLQKKDRRWNIGPFQHQKLELTEEEVNDGISSELQAFYDYLASYPLDEAKARTPLISEDRDRLIGTTTSSADEVAFALDANGGSMEFFLDQLPTGTPREVNSLLNGHVKEYRDTLEVLIRRGLEEGDGRVKISRDELHTLFEYTVGNMPRTPNKFTKFLAHRHIHTEKVRIDKPVYGVQVIFKDIARFHEYIKDYFTPVVKPAETKKVKK